MRLDIDKETNIYLSHVFVINKKKSPKPSSSKRINSTNLVKMAFIKEIEDDDEPSDPLPPSDKGKGKKKTFGAKDFLQSTM